MFNEIVKRVKRNQLISMMLFIVIAIICLAITRFNIINVVNGPENVNLVKNDIKDYNGKYIQVSIYHPLGIYEEDYVENTSTKEQNTTHYAYLIYDADETYSNYSLYGAMIPKSMYYEFNKLADESSNFLMSEDFLPTYKPFAFKGLVKKMDSIQLGYYNSVLSELGQPSVDEAYYIDYNIMPGDMDYSFVVAFTVIAGIFVLIAIIMLILSFTNRGLVSIQKYVAKHPETSLERLDYEFQSSQCFAKNVWVSKGHIFKCGPFSVKIIDLSDIVWAYYYKKTGKHPQSYIRMYNTKKRMLSVDASEKISYEILEYMEQMTPHIVLGYSKELQQTFDKNFNEFLNIKYNNSSMTEDEQFFSNI
ncbi:MAG: hypothetical protein IJC76_10230 [Lachnospiraceae bacterium]|nr:hypothetical protein [Lachnospiraceae bacterium]